MADFGIPYMGSKDSIMHKIAPLFPKADNFYDLFGGGFSVTHYMMYHYKNKYKRFFYNEIKSDVVELVKKAIDGEYNYNVFKPKWISREDFFRDKDRCAYTRLVWSFGNKQKNYLFSEENERNKKSLHNAVVFNEFDSLAIDILKIKSFPSHLSIRGRRLMCRNILIKREGELERLQQLQQLERLQQLTLSSKSYNEVEILPKSIIYCDPPYKGTTDYLINFDHNKFWNWVRDNEAPIFVSEYTAPKDIKTYAAFYKKSRLAAVSPTDSVEKIFINKAAEKIL